MPEKLFLKFLASTVFLKIYIDPFKETGFVSLNSFLDIFLF